MSASRSRTAVGICLLAALTLVVADVRGSELGGRLRSVAASVSGPVVGVLASGVAKFDDTGGVAGRIGNSQADALAPRDPIAELLADNEALRAALAKAARGELDQAAMVELAAMAPPEGYQQVPARVIAVAPPTDLVAAVTLDTGASRGVAAGAAVISAAGLVGVVDSVSPNTATVRMVSDIASTIGARVSQTKEIGLFRGSGSADRGTLQLLDPLGEMEVGDSVVTLGSHNGAPFPRGLPIGRITQISGSAVAADRRAGIATAVDLSALDEVLVLVAMPDHAQPVEDVR